MQALQKYVCTLCGLSSICDEMGASHIYAHVGSFVT
jgi:hypothetical protein